MGDDARVSPFIGSQAISSGSLTRGQLRARYTAIHPDVYIGREVQRTLAVNAHGAALWAKDAIITGRAACGIYGVTWAEAAIPIELIGRSHRPRRGVVVRNERIAADEVSRWNSVNIVTPARAALDIARHLNRTQALAYLDGLLAATGVSLDSVYGLASRYSGARGIRRARELLALADGGAQSPKESWLRLLLVDAGFPKPTSQIKVSDGFSTAYIDMGWDHLRIGLEYDGEQHLNERRQYVRDIGRYEMLSAQGWMIIRVVKEHSRGYILRRVRDAIAARSPKST